MAKLRTLLVYPNPFHALDHNGRPSGILPFEPEGDGVLTFDSRSFVGAQLSAEILQKFPQGDARQTIQTTSFKYTDEPVEVRNTPYYRQAIVQRAIIAADEKSATAAGQKFMDPKQVLRDERTAAIGVWVRQAHEEHDEEPPEALTLFAFGPMEEAVAARKAATADAKAAEEPPKKSALKKLPEGSV